MPATPKNDYYETLGVPRAATADDIRKSYRKLARKFHPDLNPGDKAAEERFRKVQEAYDILNEPKKKQMYDQHGFYSENGFPGPQPGSGTGYEQRTGSRSPNMDFNGFDFGEFANQTESRRKTGREQTGTGGFSDFFSQFLHREEAAEPEAAPERGTDLEYGLNIGFWQAIRGTQAKITVTRHETCVVCHGSGTAATGGSMVCPQCSGSGSVSQMAGAMKFNLTCPKCNGKGRLRNACPTCQGDGRLARSEVVEVRIPAGAQSGSRLRVPGKGNAGTNGAPAGDLYITTRVEEHPFFRRDADDILIKVPVTVTEAGLGAKIEVPTIQGKTLLKVPPGTENGKRFRLRERGVFNARKEHHGDQIVEVSLQTPVVQDERTKEILRELALLHPEDPRTALWAQGTEEPGAKPDAQ
jgi:molecular chaperone DnaJ